MALMTYNGIPLTAEEYAAMMADINQHTEVDPGMPPEMLYAQLSDMMTIVTNYFADTDFPLDGIYDTEREAALNAAMLASVGPDWREDILTSSPENIAATLGIPADAAAGFKEAYSQGYIATHAGPSPEKTSWWKFGLAALAGVVVGGLAVAAIKK